MALPISIFPYKDVTEVAYNFYIEDSSLILNVYAFGSQVYQTATKDSDIDLIVIVSITPKFTRDVNEIKNFVPLIGVPQREKNKLEGSEVVAESQPVLSDLQIVGKDGNDATVWTLEEFHKLLTECRVSPMECIFASQEFKFVEKVCFKPVVQHLDHEELPEDGITFTISLENLRRSFSAMSSNSWSKAWKKLTVEDDVIRGKKSMFHSLRILMFGIQIATKGRIYDYSEANHLWPTIEQSSAEQLQQNYRGGELKKLYNSLKTRFRSVASLPQ